MKKWDVVVVGGGVIGLSVAWTLQVRGARVLVVERGEPAREASFAAAGMIAACDPHMDPRLLPLAQQSAAMYPGFARELEDQSGSRVGLCTDGVIAFLGTEAGPAQNAETQPLTADALAELEPGVSGKSDAYYLSESWIDPRALCAALVAAFRHRGGDLASGSPVVGIEVESERVTRVRTEHTAYPADMVVNCCGAWAGQIGPEPFPTRPVKGQMLSVVPLAEAGSHKPLLRHVVRAPEIYLVPREDGRVVIGSTLEEAGFDKQVDPAVIRRMQQKAAEIAPAIGKARIHEVWAGLRPGTPDGLPIMGPTRTAGYYVAAGHYRDGILLAPITAVIMATLMGGGDCQLDLHAFAPDRFPR